MAKKKEPALSPEAQAANAAGDAKREKEKKIRQKNAEKQKRYRESQKMCGFRRVTLWEPPTPEGTNKRMVDKGFHQVPAWENLVRYPDKTEAEKIRFAVLIRETSLYVCAKSPEVQKALERATGEFLAAMGNTPEGRAVFYDFLELLKLLGYTWE